MRLSILSRIMEIKEGVIHRGCRQRRITPSEISIILHMIRKPDSIIVSLFIQNMSKFKNIAKICLPPWMLSSSSIVHVQGFSALQTFSKQQMRAFELSSCCSCHVFSYYFAQVLLLKGVKCPPFFYHNQNNSTSSLGLLSSNTKFFQIWSSATGYGELCVCFQPVRIGGIF